MNLLNGAIIFCNDEETIAKVIDAGKNLVKMNRGLEVVIDPELCREATEEEAADWDEEVTNTVTEETVGELETADLEAEKTGLKPEEVVENGPNWP